MFGGFLLVPGLVLVTDAMAAMGLSSGTHTIGQQKVEIINQTKAVLAGTDTLAGRYASAMICCVV